MVHGGPLRRISLILLALLCAPSLHAQNWSSFLDTSRAITWAPGFSIPNYTVPCSTQPSLLTGSGNASANTTAVQNALASCNSTHNVVNIPAGTYYLAGLNYQSSTQVVRGAGPNSTTLIITADAPGGCNGFSISICIGANTGIYFENSAVLAGGSHQCAWTSGYAQGTTTITLNSCGGTPPSNTLLVLDQANDASDTGGIYICDSATTGCTGETNANHDGRIIGGVTYSQQQSVWVTNVTGTGPYTVTISPGVYFNNIRSGQTPGAWWPGVATNDGLENLTIDQSSAPDGIAIWNCYQCWITGIRSLTAARNHIVTYENLQSVIRNNYFYGAQTPGTSQSYGVEMEAATSALLIENNIMQQTTDPIMTGQGAGNVIAYNYMVDNLCQPPNACTVMNLDYYAHNAGTAMVLWEGNVQNSFNSDSSTWGSSVLGTVFRNQITGWQLGKSFSTLGVSIESWSRAFNVVGNVLGQPGYDTTYESYATSTSGGVNGGDTSQLSIYALGWTGYNGLGGCGVGAAGGPPCGPLVRPTLMRWGNYDVVNAPTIQWNSTEAAPAAVPFVNANFTTSYFNTLAHTLPASLYYNSKPSWWPAGKKWPPIGPDVTTGNVGTCTGTFLGVQATASSQCTGGTLTSPSSTVAGWTSHVTSIPSQDCFLNTMGGPPDGSGSVLSFNASTCYSGASSPTVTLLPSTVAFGNVLLGITTPPTSTVTLTNTSAISLTINSISITGDTTDFSQSNNCGVSLGAGLNCTITVTFTPHTLLAGAATLSVSDNAVGSPQTVALSGTGIGNAFGNGSISGAGVIKVGP